MRKPAVMNSGLFLSVIPANAGIQGLHGIACGDAGKLIAASAPQAGYFSLLVQRKVTKRKHTPEPPTPPALLAPAGREPNSPSAKNALGSDTGSRLPPAEAAMLGGGYGSQRQKQQRFPKSGVLFA